MQNTRLSLLIEAVANRFDNNLWLFFALVVILGLIFLYLTLYFRRKTALFKEENLILTRLLKEFEPEKGLDNTLYQLLDIVSVLVKAPTYYCYLIDEKNKNYVLKAARITNEMTGDIGPSYSGLLPFGTEKYHPPLMLSLENLTADSRIVKDGQVPLLQVPIKGGMGLIRIGPLKRLSRRKIVLLNNLSDDFGSIIETHQEIETLKNNVETQLTSHKAMHNITSITMDLTGTISLIMSLAIKMIGAGGGFFCYREGQKIRTCYTNGLEKKVEDLLCNDELGKKTMEQLLGDREFRALNNTDKEYYQIPSYLVSTGAELYLFVNVRTETSKGMTVFWYKGIPNIELHRLTTLQMITKRLGDILDGQQRIKDMSNSYLDMLKMLVQTADNLEPHTVGFSEQMHRYVSIIARELNLDSKETEEIAQAAYLSNIGILGFSNELLFKEGKYTDLEFETMKLHSEVGAAIVEATLGNERVANYIRYHHERMDGYGYPARLEGTEIPLGSRIIAVVQTFLAKINGRNYREPLSYEKAIDLLKAASGTQLDPIVVEALINWFTKKQSNPLRKGKALGNCWEMRCAPVLICEGCPAYMNTLKNCWEVEGTHCTAHGNVCSSCLIYTEYAYRMAPKNKKNAGM